MVSDEQSVTEQQKQRARDYMAKSRNDLADAARVSEAQSAFRAGDGQWSIAEIVEHLGITEGVFLKMIAPKLSGPAQEEDEQKPRFTDEEIIAMLPQRANKFAAPERVRPKSETSLPDAIHIFLEHSAANNNFLETCETLRGRTAKHPVFGPLDGYLWCLVMAGHRERHRKQIEEIRSHAEFPANG